MRRGLVAALAGGEDRIRAGKDPRPVRLERVEGAGRGETFDDALVDRARIDPRGEVGERGEQAPLRRSSTISSTACGPTPFSAASA